MESCRKRERGKRLSLCSPGVGWEHQGWGGGGAGREGSGAKVAISRVTPSGKLPVAGEAPCCPDRGGTDSWVSPASLRWHRLLWTTSVVKKILPNAPEPSPPPLPWNTLGTHGKLTVTRLLPSFTETRACQDPKTLMNLSLWSPLRGQDISLRNGGEGCQDQFENCVSLVPSF